MRKLKWRKAWENTEVRQFFWCFIGVVAYKVMDLAGQTLSIDALSLGYVGFAVIIALIITLATDNDPIPTDKSPFERKKIYRRIAKQAILMGFFWQTVLSKIEELIEI
jgi:hypothetical protein